MKTIKECLQSIKQEHRSARAAALRESFDVTERDGHLWLTHDGVAIQKFKEIATAGAVAAMLKQARECAIAYERL